MTLSSFLLALFALKTLSVFLLQVSERLFKMSIHTAGDPWGIQTNFTNWFINLIQERTVNFFFWNRQEKYAFLMSFAYRLYSLLFMHLPHGNKFFL